MNKPYVFQDKQSVKWFYAFDYRWVGYRANQGYATKEEARQAAMSHQLRVAQDEKITVSFSS